MADRSAIEWTDGNDRERIPATIHVRVGIALHLDYLLEFMKSGEFESSPAEFETVKSIFHRIDRFNEPGFGNYMRLHAATLKMMGELGAFYARIHGEFPG